VLHAYGAKHINKTEQKTQTKQNKTHKQHKAKLPNTEHANHQIATLHFPLLLEYSLMILPNAKEKEKHI
jgi:hypothetical protein